MNSRMILPMLPVLLTMVMFAGSQSAEAADISVSVGGSSRHHHGRSYSYRTADPVYSTWYPETTTYVYTPSRPTTYYSTGRSTTYVYSTQSNDYNGWYGNGRSGRGSNYSSRRSHYGHGHR